ncbi:hypothetical protein PPACK8108_LOCUS5241 [Phakopsora pachyrhizi]|uniref:Uncharacterized protein n=1 Tax=Phakopsora pachyrhizi TaxID=170000 RepID=A0AAV0ASG5_PHAPC|nr:hypothetical protein PPACK8108_LOCUS5241 [Phakopsora pachyrhizi]
MSASPRKSDGNNHEDTIYSRINTFKGSIESQTRLLVQENGNLENKQAEAQVLQLLEELKKLCSLLVMGTKLNQDINFVAKSRLTKPPAARSIGSPTQPPTNKRFISNSNLCKILTDSSQALRREKLIKSGQEIDKSNQNVKQWTDDMVQKEKNKEEKVLKKMIESKMPCCCAEKRVGLMDDLLAAAEIVLTWVSSPILGFNSSKWIDIEAQARQKKIKSNHNYCEPTTISRQIRRFCSPLFEEPKLQEFWTHLKNSKSPINLLAVPSDNRDSGRINCCHKPIPQKLKSFFDEWPGIFFSKFQKDFVQTTGLLKLTNVDNPIVVSSKTLSLVDG